jgi:hypothetical protein
MMEKEDWDQEDCPVFRPLAEGECGLVQGGDRPGICRLPSLHLSFCESDGGGLPSQRSDLPDEMVLPGLPEHGAAQQVTVITPDGAHRAEVTSVRLGLSPYILMTMEGVADDGSPMFHIEWGGGMSAAQARDVFRSLATSLSAEGGEHVQRGEPGGADAELPGAARTDLGAGD